MRHADWDSRLWQTVEAWSGRAFSWGTVDCARFAAACVEAVSGRAIALPYRDRRAALRFMAREGGLREAVTARLGEPVAQLAARRGDVALFLGDDGECLGVCLGPAAAAMTPRGLTFVRMEHARLAWRVD